MSLCLRSITFLVRVSWQLLFHRLMVYLRSVFMLPHFHRKARFSGYSSFEEELKLLHVLSWDVYIVKSITKLFSKRCFTIYSLLDMCIVLHFDKQLRGYIAETHVNFQICFYFLADFMIGNTAISQWENPSIPIRKLFWLSSLPCAVH